MSNKQMPDEEILKNYGYNAEELQEYLDMLESVDNKDKKQDKNHSHDDNCQCEHDHNSDCKKDCCEHDDCDCENDDCDCHSHTGAKPKFVKMCVLEEGVSCCNCGACNMCDLDPNKVCDNCGKCLDTLNTDEKGFVHVPIDKIITGEGDDELQALLAAYGLEDDEDENEDNQ